VSIKLESILKKSQLKKTDPIKSLKMLAEAGDKSRLQEARIFRLFIGPVFFIAIRLGICGSGSAPQFAANAILMVQYRVRPGTIMHFIYMSVAHMVYTAHGVLDPHH
jgi:hypothetical protein